MSKSRPLAGRAAPWAAALALLLAGGLSGCGVAGTDFHPGVAAQVGDETITVSEVDSVASNYCSAITSQLQSNNQVAAPALPAQRRRWAGSRWSPRPSSSPRTRACRPGAAYDQKVAAAPAVPSPRCPRTSRTP